MSLEKELNTARLRLASQTAALEQTSAAHAEAVSRGMLATQSTLAVKLTRQRDAVGKTAAMIKELEAALSAPRKK